MEALTSLLSFVCFALLVVTVFGVPLTVGYLAFFAASRIVEQQGEQRQALDAELERSGFPGGVGDVVGRRVRATAGLDAIRLEVDLAWDGPNTYSRGHSDSDALTDAFYMADHQGFHGLHLELRRALRDAGNLGRCELEAGELVITIDNADRARLERALDALTRALHAMDAPPSLARIVEDDPDPDVKAAALQALAAEDIVEAQRVSRDLPRALNGHDLWFATRAMVQEDEKAVEQLLPSASRQRIALAMGGLDVAACARLLPLAATRIEAMEPCCAALADADTEEARFALRHALLPWLDHADPLHDRFEPVFACLWSAIDPELTSRDADWVEDLLHCGLGHAYPHVVTTYTRVADRTDGLTTLHALLEDTTSSVAKNAILDAIRTLQGDRSDVGGLSIVESAGGELAVAEDDERRRLARAGAPRQRT